MPNTRRRRFSVQNDIGGRGTCKMQNGLQNSHQDISNTKTVINRLSSVRSSRSKNKMFPSNSKNPSILEIVAECDSSTSTAKTNYLDKDVTASSSNIDLFIILNNVVPTEQSSEALNPLVSPPKIREARPPNTDRSTMRRDKHPRQHRIKVRSPRRRPPVLDQKINDSNKRSIGTTAIDWVQEEEVYENHVTDLTEANEERRMSSHSLDDMCRICHSGDSLSIELGQLISACACRGTVGRVHVKCLERWLTESGKSRCELCGTRYATKRVHKYGIPKSLLMWILSQNAKQLMVDSLGIMLMSPLAILAAWLTGRTLAGLMSQENPATPWPLASTFVLACMTLVCYYCWIVSAATRHALGWWIWYRSQYEVRLELQDGEE